MTDVALLEHFRPPEGFKTTAALVTTYSADLIACMALLVSMDGGNGDKLDCSKISAMRAIERLRNSVLFVANANRVNWGNSGDARIMALFDRSVRTVPFDCRDRSFHPKVIIARQVNKENVERYVLYIGSRNLTSSTAWDFGVALVGRPRSSLPTGHRKFQGLYLFVRAVLTLVKETQFLQKFTRLDDVVWELPADVDNIDFRFHAGGGRQFEDCALSALPRNGKVLLLSPFLSPRIVEDISKHFRNTEEVHLISGKHYLDLIAQSTARSCLKDENENGPIIPLQMELASDDPLDEPLSAEPDGEMLPEGRGLHAKVFAVANDFRATIIIGSANLTTNAWLRDNWEAFVLIRGPAAIAAELFEWGKLHGQVYRLPAKVKQEKEKTEPINELRSALAATQVTLNESTHPNRLICPTLPQLLASSSVKLRVTRMTTPTQWVPWRNTETSLPECQPSEHTSFLLVEATGDGPSETWVQCVELQPPIDAERDRHAFVRILGVDDFLRYLQSLLDNGESSSEGDGDPQDSSSHSTTTQGRPSSGIFQLESLLRYLASDRTLLHEIDETVKRYDELFTKMPLTEDERHRLSIFLGTWRAIAAGMRI